MAPRLLVLGGCTGIGSDGFVLAGWDVLDVDLDHRPLAHNPHPHLQADMLEVLWDKAFCDQFDAIVAHPPCQGESALRCLRDAQGKSAGRPLVDFDELRTLLRLTGKPWVIENVPRSPLRNPVTTCGSVLGLGVRRHRWWETEGFRLSGTGCDHKAQGRPWGVYGSWGDNIPDGGRTARDKQHAMALMGVSRTVPDVYLRESVPPLMTFHVGIQMLAQTSQLAA